MMVKKTPAGSKRSRVTFEVPAEVGASTVHVCGDFNDWSESATPLAQRKDGRFSVTLMLDQGRTYKYRYLVDGSRWENDWNADSYAKNDFGGDDSVIEV